MNMAVPDTGCRCRKWQSSVPLPPRERQPPMGHGGGLGGVRVASRPARRCDADIPIRVGEGHGYSIEKYQPVVDGRPAKAIRMRLRRWRASPAHPHRSSWVRGRAAASRGRRGRRRPGPGRRPARARGRAARASAARGPTSPAPPGPAAAVRAGDVAGLDDDGGVADRLAGPAGQRGDHRAAAGQHLLGQRDAERLDEVGLRLGGQGVGRAAAHQQRLLVVVDVGEEDDAVVACGQLAGPRPAPGRCPRRRA